MGCQPEQPLRKLMINQVQKKIATIPNPIQYKILPIISMPLLYHTIKSRQEAQLNSDNFYEMMYN